MGGVGREQRVFLPAQQEPEVTGFMAHEVSIGKCVNVSFLHSCRLYI